jgi:crossover junction endodeoxyribonuclease RuvC
MARMNVRQMWAAKLAGKSVPAAQAAPSLAAMRVPFEGQVLGIDPVAARHGSRADRICPRPPAGAAALPDGEGGGQAPDGACARRNPPRRGGVLKDFTVRHVALEQTIYVQNFQTAQILGAARGAAISAAALQATCRFLNTPRCA